MKGAGVALRGCARDWCNPYSPRSQPSGGAALLTPRQKRRGGFQPRNPAGLEGEQQHGEQQTCEHQRLLPGVVRPRTRARRFRRRPAAPTRCSDGTRRHTCPPPRRPATELGGQSKPAQLPAPRRRRDMGQFRRRPVRSLTHHRERESPPRPSLGTPVARGEVGARRQSAKRVRVSRWRARTQGVFVRENRDRIRCD